MTNKSHNGFGARLRTTREARSITASELARLTRVTPTAVWNWENNGVTPQAKTQTDLATVLNVSKDWLLTGEGVTAQEAPPRTAPDLSSFPLEDLMAAID